MNGFTIGIRIKILAGMGILLALLLGSLLYLALLRVETIAGQQLGDSLFEGQKDRLKLGTDALAATLAADLKGIESREAQVALLRKIVSDFRYEDDKSGYYFIYEGTINVVLGPSPSAQGQDLGGRTDSNGVTFVKEMAKQAQNGGGFVRYVFPKPNKGEQPKLSYATVIPGTPYWIGTGVYIDNLETLKAEARQAMQISVLPMKRLSVGIGAVLVLALMIASYFVNRSITRPLNLAISNLSAGSDQTAQASAQVSDASQSLASGATQQAASLEETAAALEEMSGMTRRNADSAVKAKTVAGATRGAAEEGAAQMGRMSTAMSEIQASSGEIAKIIKTIDEIAFQTNILALNAAVEAARAGEAGAGFAVVAEEVRNLAQRSALASRETATKIELAIHKSQQGVEISAGVAGRLNTIVDRAREVDSLVAEIAAGSMEQDQGIKQITTSITQMDQVVQGNAARAEETASASEELRAQAAELHNVIEDLNAMIRGRSSPGSPS